MTVGPQDYRARTLKQAFRNCNVGALTGAELNRFRVDLSQVRNEAAIAGVSRELDFLEPGEAAAILFTGHRGCGKSTELRRLERQWELADTSVSINNALWLTGLVAGLGSIILGMLYGWLLQTLRQHQQVTVSQERETQTLAAKLHAKTADLKNTTAIITIKIIDRLYFRYKLIKKEIKKERKIEREKERKKENTWEKRKKI